MIQLQVLIDVVSHKTSNKNKYKFSHLCIINLLVIFWTSKHSCAASRKEKQLSLTENT